MVVANAVAALSEIQARVQQLKWGMALIALLGILFSLHRLDVTVAHT